MNDLIAAIALSLIFGVLCCCLLLLTRIEESLKYIVLEIENDVRRDIDG
jgi:hypothetical protein